jgi:hypothetical protein
MAVDNESSQSLLQYCATVVWGGFVEKGTVGVAGCDLGPLISLVGGCSHAALNADTRPIPVIKRTITRTGLGLDGPTRTLLIKTPPLPNYRNTM